MTTLDEIVAAILDGAVDEDLDQVAAALRTRQGALEARKRLGLRVGDRVIFNTAASPQYLRGVGAKIVNLNPRTVVLNVDENPRARRFAGMKSVRCPVGIVDRVEEA